MPNRLVDETSPYLLQHADNPVDWYPWGEEAFEQARRLDKPVLLSVGYSSCHWCHVMAHESFEDPETAAVMNELYVNVKVDREERPDVDSIYMNAVQAMTGRGGWPMTVWLTPEAKPFYAGTYFPKDDRHGMPSFRRVMEGLHQSWLTRRGDLSEQADRVAASIDRTLPIVEALPGRDTLEAAYRSIAARADELHGGIGGAPKFPQEPVLEFLLRSSDFEFAEDARQVAFHALEAMAAGGIYDHIGGGFYRYAVDKTWTIPHFEKMLYTNAQLARLYLRAWQQGGPERFKRVAVDTLEYLLRDLRVEHGFGSAEDADSEGVEGKFYVFSQDELRQVTGADADVAERFFGVRAVGNFEGSNHLRQTSTVSDVALGLGMGEAEVVSALDRARAALLEHRAPRVRPGLDDKVITAWNALAIRAFAEAGAVLREPRYIDVARETARFIGDKLVVNGRLQRSYAKGRTSGAAFLDDHAGLAVALYTLFQATGELEWYQWADDLVAVIESDFLQDGELFSTSADSEQLITRPKDQMDNPLPSGSSLAAEAFLVRSLFTGKGQARFERAVREAGALFEQYPTAAAHMLSLLASRELGLVEVAVTGPDAETWADSFWKGFRHNAVAAVDDAGGLADHIPLLSGRWSATETRAFLCRDFVCDLPAETREDFEAQLAQLAG